MFRITMVHVVSCFVDNFLFAKHVIEVRDARFQVLLCEGQVCFAQSAPLQSLLPSAKQPFFQTKVQMVKF
jgi:hypothetical protein